MGSTDEPPVIARVNLLRALNPSEGYPRFRLGLAVDDARYDLVLSSPIADWLRVYCTDDDREQIDKLAAGATPNGLRAAMVAHTSATADPDRQLFSQIELETVAHVRADRLCETAEYSYLFVSRGIARRLCLDAEADRLDSDLCEYVLQHRSVFSKCGGFELLTACFESLGVDAFVRKAGVSSERPDAALNEAPRHCTFLRALL